LIYNRTIIIELHTKYLPPSYFTQMADQYGVTPEDYVYDIKLMSLRRYSQGMPFSILSLSEQRLKHFQVIAATLMMYDLTNHIPQQVRLPICK